MEDDLQLTVWVTIQDDASEQLSQIASTISEMQSQFEQLIEKEQEHKSTLSDTIKDYIELIGTVRGAIGLLEEFGVATAALRHPLALLAGTVGYIIYKLDEYVEKRKKTAHYEFKYGLYVLVDNEPPDMREGENSRAVEEKYLEKRIKKDLQKKAENNKNTIGVQISASNSHRFSEDQLQDKLVSINSSLDLKIAKEKENTYAYNILSLEQETNQMRQELEDRAELYREYGIDTSSVLKKINYYQTTMTAEYQEQQKTALEKLKNETKLAQAQILGDKTKVAEVEYEIACEAIENEKRERIKAVGDEKAVNDWAVEQKKMAEQKKVQAVREAEAEQHKLRIQYNTFLSTVGGKSQKEVDLINAKELRERKSKLEGEIALVDNKDFAKLVPIQQELAEINQQLDAIYSRDPSKAAELAMRRLKARTTDYAAIMVDAFDRINSSMEGHFTKMLTGAESFSQGFKGIFKDMTDTILQMMIKMWYNKVILEPLTNLWGGLLQQWFPSSNKTQDTQEEYKLQVGDLSLYGEKKELGGPVLGGESYLVGEKGPEIFTPFTPGTIIPNNRIAEALAATGESSARIQEKSNERPIVINFNISTPDANSFRRSSSQITADMARALQGAVRNL